MRRSRASTVVPAPGWDAVRLAEPAPHGYVHVGLTSGRWLLPPALPSRRRRRMLARLQELAALLRGHPDVRRADVFRGYLRPPGSSNPAPDQSAPTLLPDAVLLVETTTSETASSVLEHPALQALLADRSTAHAFAASNVRRIGAVDHDRQGVFLFNYFSADDVASNLHAWQHTAGWFQEETGLDNSTVLAPLAPGAGEHTLVNHCRWDRPRDVLPSLAFKRSFRTYVLHTFARNRVTPRPLLYRLDRPASR